MAFITDYSNTYRQLPLNPSTLCMPEYKWAELQGTWLQDGGKQPELNWNDEEREAFLRRANRDFFWTSTYTNDYCKKIKIVERKTPPAPKKPKCGKTVPKSLEEKKDIDEVGKKTEEKGENELMIGMRSLFERDPQRLVRQPLKTHRRILGYASPSTYQCGLSTYQDDIAQAGYIFMRDKLVKKPSLENGHRPKHAISPLFILPLGERLIH